MQLDICVICKCKCSTWGSGDSPKNLALDIGKSIPIPGRGGVGHYAHKFQKGTSDKSTGLIESAKELYRTAGEVAVLVQRDTGSKLNSTTMNKG